MTIISDRLSMLERRLRRTQACLVAVAAGIIAVLAMAAIQDPKSIKPVSPGPIRATRFDIVDSKERVRGSWEIANDGGEGSPLLTLCDAASSSRIALSVVADMPVITVSGALKDDGVMRERILLSIGQDASPDIRVFDSDGMLRSQLCIGSEGAVFLLMDKSGKTVFQAPVK
jgi:hypothetical protein